MKFVKLLAQTERRRAATLAIIIIVQALSAAFFLVDVIADFSDDAGDGQFHISLETVMAGALVCGVVFLMFELSRIMQHITRMETGIRAARGEMADLIDGFFTKWSLTPAERDVALMVLKGIDNDTIAQMRGTASGTVRAQCTSIYSKAGVDGRAQLFSVFMEELLADPETRELAAAQ